jgi:hypothetical protein
LYLSVRDLIAWDAGVRAGRVLSAASWKEVFTPVRLASGKTYPYGFGWMIDERGGKPLIQHSGSWQGFKTRYSRFVGDDLSIIVLANLREAEPSRFVDGIAAMFNPALGLPVPTAIDDREPQVTARMKQLVEAARRGALSPADFAYAGSFFPDEAKDVAQELTSAGDLQRVKLLERRELGDDRVYLYELGFTARTLLLRLGLAPDDRMVIFSLTQK